MKHRHNNCKHLDYCSMDFGSYFCLLTFEDLEDIEEETDCEHWEKSNFIDKVDSRKWKSRSYRRRR